MQLNKHPQKLLQIAALQQQDSVASPLPCALARSIAPESLPETQDPKALAPYIIQARALLDAYMNEHANDHEFKARFVPQGPSSVTFGGHSKGPVQLQIVAGFGGGVAGGNSSV